MKQSILFTLFLLLSSTVFSQEAITDTVANDDSLSHRTHCNPPVVTCRATYLYGTNITRMMDGLAAGLQSTNGGGQPGASAELMLRGYSTLERDNAPLFVVDGFPYTGDIGALDPQDIESVEVLKDAAAALEYIGSGNANGVIAITTKKAKEHKRLTVDARAGIITPALQSYKTVNQQQFYEITFDGLKNSAMVSGTPEAEAGQQALSYLIPMLGYNAYDVPDNELIDPATGKLNPAAQLKHQDSWKDESRRVGLHHSYNLSFENKNNRTDYRLSSGYTNEQGYIINTGYERFNLRLDANHQLLPWLKVGINASGALTSQDYINNNGINSYSNPIFVSQLIPSIYPVYYRNTAGEREVDPVTGDYKYNYDNRGFGSGTNAIAAQKYRQNEWNTKNIVLLPYIKVRFLEDFSFTTSFNLNYLVADRLNSVSPLYEPIPRSFKSESNYSGVNYAVRGELGWAKRLKGHDFDIKLLSNFQRNKMDEEHSAYDDSTSYSGHHEEYSAIRMLQFSALLNYNFKEKYYMFGGISYTDNGSSYFYNGHVGSFFNWAAGIGWMLSNENFIKNNNVFDELKLRASYGNVLRKTVMVYSNDIYPNIYYGDNKQYYLNGGLDFAVANRRISGAIDLYKRTGRTDMSIMLPHNQLPIFIDSIEISNTGIDFSLQFDIIRKSRIDWRLKLIAGSYTNKILEMPDRWDSLAGPTYLITKGQSGYSFSLPESAGVDPATGDELWYYTKANGQRATTNDYGLAAELRSRVNAGSMAPSLFGGIQNSVFAGRFDLYINLTFGLGGKIFDNTYAHLMAPGITGANYSTDMLDRWTPENRHTDIPKASFQTQPTGPSTRFLKDASYLNIRTVTVGYNILEEQKRKGKTLKSIRIYLTCDNLWLFSARRGMNPQANFNGISSFVYAPARTILLGVSVGL